MKTSYAIGFATLYGFTVRLLFNIFADLTGIMTLSFLVLAPFVIGFLTVFLIKRNVVIRNTAAFFRPWITSLCILFITIICNVEGTICWIMIYPFFSIVAGIGGLVANRFRARHVEIEDEDNYDYWTKPDKMTASFLMVIPIILAIVEGQRTQDRKDMLITRSVVIHTTPAKVWSAIARLDAIPREENAVSMSTMMGFPRHIQTNLDTLAIGGKRKALYEHGLYFDETIRVLEPERRLVLDINIDPAKIPPGVMDEHILLGGKHVDILEDIYMLQPLPDGTCKLSLASKFFINTPFNWYAGIWADYLMSDILDDELHLIASRATR